MKQSPSAIHYLDSILSALNHVEHLRDAACNDLDPYCEKATKLWRTAQSFEQAIIHENQLPDLDALLQKICREAETGYGDLSCGNEWHSYVQSAKALFEIYLMLKKAITPKLRWLLEIIYVDGYTAKDCYVTDAMVGKKKGVENEAPKPEIIA